MVGSRLNALPRALVFLYAGTIASRLGTFVVPYLTLYLSQGRGLSRAGTGRIIAAGSVGLLVGNLMGGWLADRVGRKPTLLAALAVNVIGIGALSWSLPSGWAYAVALAVAMVGAGMYTPAANALIADCTSETERPLAYTVNYICINIGMGLGPLLGGLLAAYSFTGLFVGDIVTTLVCAGLIARGIPSTRPRSISHVPALRSTLGIWRRHLPLVAFCGASFLLIAPLMGLEYAVPLVVGTVLHEPLAFVGLVYSINAACILALSLPVERWLRGRDELAMMALAGALWTAGLAIVLVDLSLASLLACTVVWTMGEIIASVVVPTYVSRHVDPAAKGRMLAVQDAVRSLAGIAAPITLGLLWDEGGLSTVLVTLVATPAVGALIYLVWGHGRDRVGRQTARRGDR